MKYALVDGIKTEAIPKAQGKCLCCGAEVIAKCGNIRERHWAHKNKEKCNYSEKERKTHWHENWQNLFPKEWQEVRCTDEQTGEVHIADIKTLAGLVVELQHSYISAEDKLAREQFYKNMIWVVDCYKKNDYKKFVKKICNLSILYKKDQEIPFSLYRVFRVDEILPLIWSEITAPVYFDFRNIKEIDKKMAQYTFWYESIWGFYLIDKQIIAIEMNFDYFVKLIENDAIQDLPNAISNILNHNKF